MQVTVRFDGIGHPNVGQASLWIGAPDDPPPRSAVRRFTDRLVALLPYPPPECGDSRRPNLEHLDLHGRRYPNAIALENDAAEPVGATAPSGSTVTENPAPAVLAYRPPIPPPR